MEKGSGKDRRWVSRVMFSTAHYKIIIGMVDKNPKISFFNLPSLDKFPEYNQSMQMINTLNMIPNQPSLDNLDIPPQHSLEEDSLAERISHVPTASNSHKKRKIGCTCKKTYCLKMYC